MRPRTWALFAVVLALQALGCCHLCRCCGGRDEQRPPANTRRGEVPLPPPAFPPPVLPASHPKPTGAYGGS